MRGLVAVVILLLPAMAQLNPIKSRPAEGGKAGGTLAEEILAIKRQYDEAQLKNDRGWFQRMFAEDYIFVLPDSAIVTKAEVVKDLQSRDLVWESVSGSDVRVRIYRDIAVVTGQFFGKGRCKERFLMSTSSSHPCG